MAARVRIPLGVPQTSWSEALWASRPPAGSLGYTAAALSAIQPARLRAAIDQARSVLGTSACSDAYATGQALSDEALSDEALSDEALSDEALSDEALSDEALETFVQDLLAGHSAEPATQGTANRPHHLSWSTWSCGAASWASRKSHAASKGIRVSST